MVTLRYFVVFRIVSLVFICMALAEQDKLSDILQSYFLYEAPEQIAISNCLLYLNQLTEHPKLAMATYTLANVPTDQSYLHH